MPPKRSLQVIAGHGRLQAAIKLCLDSVPVVIVNHLTDVQKRAYTLIDNTLALNVTWDDALLRQELSNLSLDDFDLSLIGLEDFPLLLEKEEDESDEDEGEEEDEDDGSNTTLKSTKEDKDQPTRTQVGQIWQLGQHRLAVGSSEDATLVGKLLEGYAPNLMVTDPPYGIKLNVDSVAKQLTQAPKEVREKYKNRIKSNSQQTIQNDDRGDWKKSYELFSGNVVYCWHSSLQVVKVISDFEELDFEFRQQIIWNKSIMIFGRSAYHWKHEPCAYFVRKGASANWVGDRKQTTVWDMESPKRGGVKKTDNEDENFGTEHPTQKPVEVYTIPIQNHTQIGDALYDPFAGSGTVFIAAQKTGRVGLGVELDPYWADAAIARWEALTGRKAALTE